MELRWVASLSATSIHMADAVARGWPLVDPRLSDVALEAARELCEKIRSGGLPESRFWRNLTALAHQIENNRELALTAIRRTVGGGAAHDELASRLAVCIGNLESAVSQAVPQLVDDLAHRGRPIREIWESFGPGLLRAIASLTEEQLIAPHAEVVLVHPVLGGGGAAQLINNSVRFEAVLTNNVPQLPEAVRLGWLLAQLNHDLPALSETLAADRLPTLAQLAMLPVTLRAAQELDISQLNTATLELAASQWRIDCPPHISIAETVSIWWETYATSRPAWPVALAALDKMVFEGRS